MEQPRVSIIVPTKNEEIAIEDCLRSLAAQRTQHAYEIITVDANSTDKTREIAARYGARIITEDRPGKSLARQTGAQAALGEILCFTEADCRVPETWVDTIVQAFADDPKTVAATGPYTLMKSTWPYDLLVQIFMPISVYAFRLLYGHHSVRATNLAMRKSAFLETGGFNTSTMELDDVEFSMRARKHGRVGYVPAMSVQTLDRRFRNRLLTYIKEFIVSFYRVGIRREPVKRQLYTDIR